MNKYNKYTTIAEIAHLLTPEAKDTINKHFSPLTDNPDKNDMEKRDLRLYTDDLVDIIRNLLFEDVKHTKGFKDCPEEEKKKIVDDYIEEQIKSRNW